MTDRKTVITDLQIIHTWAEFAIERDLQFFTKKHLENIAQWTDNALELMKEDCHNCKLECLLQKYDELKEKYDKLLKEQESTTFKPHYIDEYGTHFICGVECGSCHEKISRTYHYCPYCGKAVKWE